MRWRGSASSTIPLALVVLLAGGCSGDSGGASPPPLSIEQYDATLSGAAAPLGKALNELAKTWAYKGLADQVTTVATAADRAAVELTDITPPVELGAEHAKLVTALEAFHDELDDLSSQVDNRSLCTGSAVRARLGDAEGTSDLRKALTTVQGKLPGDRDALRLPAAGQKPGPRPGNGELLRADQLNGYGQLKVQNGGNDAVVTLSKKREPVVSVYVRANKETTVKGVRDGSYTVFFTSGARWDGKVRAFGRDCTFQESEKQAEFRTTDRYATIETYTLYPVANGNAPTKKVDPEDFPDS
jgi:hypothetical protein